MKKLIVVAFLAIGVVGGGHAQEVPKEIKMFLDNYNKDSTVDGGPLYAKRGRFLSDTVKLKDMRVGRVLQEYKFKHIFLDAYPDTVAFSEIIEPSGRWFVLIRVLDKPAYELWLRLDKTIGKAVYIGMSETTPIGSMWETLSKAYPESKGINPIYMTMFNNPYLLYFKEIGPRKLCYVSEGVKDKRLAELLPGPVDTLGDSKRFIEYLKMQGINELGMSRERMEEKRKQEGKAGQPRKMGGG